MNWRYAIGVTTIVGVLGVTAYSIYLWKKQQKIEENEISIEEARAMISKEDLDAMMERAQDIKKEEPDVEFDAKIEDHDRIVEEAGEPWHKEEQEESVNEQILNIVNANRKESKMAMTPEEVDEAERIEEEERVEAELKAEEEMWDAEPEPVLLKDEGEGILRYDPNSEEAMMQFMRMHLSDWHPDDGYYETLEMLFDNTEFVPAVEGDQKVFSNLVDYRSEFFGPASVWAQRITFADLIFYYARQADFHVGGGVKFWVQEFISSNEFDQMNLDDIEEMIDEMNHHEYWNEGYDHYGFFALDLQDMAKVEQVAQQSIGKKITYDMEFQQFLSVAVTEEGNHIPYFGPKRG